MVNDKVRNIELDLLRQFKTISKELKWWFENQTMVEIIEYGKITLEKGYLEIGMLRDDYEEFIQRCKNIGDPYVLKTYINNNFPRGYSKLVNRNTTAIVVEEGLFDIKNIAQGLFIIIYAFDKILERENNQILFKEIAKRRSDSVNNFIRYQNGYIDNKEYKMYCSRYNMFLTRENKSDSKYISNLSLSTTRNYADTRYIKEATDLFEIELEGIKGYLPKNYKELKGVLKNNYNLNEKIQKIDPEKSYTDYLFKPIEMSDEEFISKLNFKIDNNFLEEEVRCNYTVTAKMKRQWALCIDLIIEFDRVCKENNIMWFADGGTLLGAIRHKGFVPWDDDVDIMILREDYDKLLKHADQFKGKYFLQTFDNDYVCKAKVRLMNTESSVLLTYESIKDRFHQEKLGCFIDIFPLDNIKDDIQWTSICAKRSSYLKAAKLNKELWKKTGDEILKEKMIKNYYIFDKITKEGKLLGKTKYGANLGFLQASNFLKREMEDYDNLVYQPFEMIQLPCPKGYKRCLDYIYGKDWTVFKKNLSKHNIWKYDVNTPYINYYNYYQTIIK